MLKKLRKLKKEEHGQALVFFVGVFAILLGIMALVVDVGNVYWQKAELQNAVDAAALAGAQELPTNKDDAESIALTYATNNEVENDGKGTTVIPNADYAEDDRQIEVVATRVVSPIFAKVLEPFTVSASAVAEKKYVQWPGDSLPFLNQDTYANWTTGYEFLVWSKVDANGGDKESIYSFEIEYSPSDSSKRYPFTKVDYTQPIELKNGFANGQKDSDGDKKKDVTEKIITNANIGKTFYVLSLSNDSFTLGQVWAQDKGKGPYMYKDIADLTNKDIVAPIDPNTNKPQFVLLEGTLVSFKQSNQHDIKLKFNRVYKILEGEFPQDYVYPNESNVKLIK